MRTVRCNVCLDRFEEPAHHSAEERHLIRLVTQDFTGTNGRGEHLCPECIAYFSSALKTPALASQARAGRRALRRAIAHPA